MSDETERPPCATCGHMKGKHFLSCDECLHAGCDCTKYELGRDELYEPEDAA